MSRWVIAVAFTVAVSGCYEDARVDPELGDVEQATQLSDFEAYVIDNLCANAAEDDCLEPIVVNACASGCPRRGYNWRGATPGRIDIHMTLTYLRMLRNLAAASPTAQPAPSVSWGMNAEQMLWHQVQMMLRTSYTKFYATNAGTSDGTIAPLTPGQVSTSNIVDPTRFYAVAWTNSAGTAHAMSQADAALWFQSVAANFATAGDSANTLYYLQLSERAFRPYGMRDNDGGVRNNKRSYRCYNGRYCYWFHSFAVGEYAYPSSVLNQNLHAIRDAMEAHNQLRTWPGGLPAGTDPNHMAYLLDWARGGLLQLAFGAGNHVDVTAPPNLSEFEVPLNDTSDGCDSYGYASYDYELGGTRTCIKPNNTCHYHYHSLSVLRRIIDLIEIDPAFAGDADVVAGKFKLLYGRNVGDTRTCAGSIPSSAKVMSGVPLARLYHTSATTPFRIYCDGNDSNDSDYPDGGEYHDSADWADTSNELRAWYDGAYAGCTF